ncbi:hypothetical protein GCM10008937_33380 [Deinococcus depolymerans]|uniref:Uncharacterized protein n=1 Tax=Deinococcus depolymerans TaxID=392408 RepID=A0ABP3MQ50_9DEIO
MRAGADPDAERLRVVLFHVRVRGGFLAEQVEHLTRSISGAGAFGLRLKGRGSIRADSQSGSGTDCRACGSGARRLIRASV